MDFKEKLMRISKIITEAMSKKNLNALRNNLNTPRLGLIEFTVNVTLSLTGLYTMNQLKSVLSDHELVQLAKIQEGRRPNEDKSTAIGQILQEAYRHSPTAVREQWPPIFGSNQFPEDLKKAINYMLFSENPSKNITPFAKIFRQAYLSERAHNQRGLRKRDTNYYRFTKAHGQAYREMLW